MTFSSHKKPKGINTCKQSSFKKECFAPIKSPAILYFFLQLSKDQFSFFHLSCSPFFPNQSKGTRLVRACTEKQPEDKHKSSYRSPRGKDISTILSSNSSVSVCEEATQRTVHSRDKSFRSTKRFILSLHRKEVLEMYFSLLSGITRMLHMFILVETISLVNHCINVISTCLK